MTRVRDTARPAIEQRDFRAAREIATVHDGKAIWLRVCSEVVDGRWEGFVSIRSRTITPATGDTQ